MKKENKLTALCAFDTTNGVTYVGKIKPEIANLIKELKLLELPRYIELTDIIQFNTSEIVNEVARDKGIGTYITVLKSKYHPNPHAINSRSIPLNSAYVIMPYILD